MSKEARRHDEEHTLNATLEREDTQRGHGLDGLAKPGIVGQKYCIPSQESHDRVDLVREQSGRPSNRPRSIQQQIGRRLEDGRKPFPQGRRQVLSCPRGPSQPANCSPRRPRRVVHDAHRKIDAPQRPFLDLAYRAARGRPPRPIPEQQTRVVSLNIRLFWFVEFADHDLDSHGCGPYTSCNPTTARSKGSSRRPWPAR